MTRTCVLWRRVPHGCCLKNWTRIRRFRIANPLGHLEEALAVARGEKPPPYPVGTIIQLIPFEAMVKRGRGEVTNIGPISCFACHGAAPQKDFVCETGNGCIALSLSEDLINALQEHDPRCPVSAAAQPWALQQRRGASLGDGR